MSVTPFSHFSAASELFVSAGVFYFFYMALRRDDFRWAFIGIAIVFETVFNITYMAVRLAQADTTSPELGPWATVLVAGHGTLSLAMFLGLVAFVLLGYRHHRVEKENLFRRRIGLTWTFLLLWTASVLSGEAIYVLQLTGTLQL